MILLQAGQLKFVFFSLQNGVRVLLEQVDQLLVPTLQFRDLIVFVSTFRSLMLLEYGRPPFIANGIGINFMLQFLDMLKKHFLIIFLLLKQFLQVEYLLLNDLQLLP